MTVGENALPLCLDEAPGDLPSLRLEPSWHPGHWRLREMQNGSDQRLPRLMGRFGANLDAQTIHAAAASFPDDRPELLSGLEATVPPGRDDQRRWLATDMLLNAARAEPEALAALIADGAWALSRRTPRVSIIINNYNYAPYLGAAIDSALAQQRPADEVIVVDDGSTDGSAEVIARYPGVTAICKTNGGQGSAFNAGFAASTGDLIVFLDADDRLRPDAVARLVAEPLDGIARLSFGLETIDAQGHPTGLYPISRQAEGGALEGPLRSRGFLMMMPTSGNAFPRATLEALLPMPEAPWRISADVYLIFGAACLGDARHLPEVLGQYRVHGANAYHATLGAEAPYAPRKIAQRRQALADIAVWLKRPEMRRPVRRTRAWLPLGEPGGWAHRPDPVRFGGPSCWPILGPGAVRDLTEPLTEPPFGPGWQVLPDAGVALEARVGMLGLRLSGPRADWTLRLLHAETEAVEIEPWINGLRHDPLRLDGTGALTLQITGSLLELDRATRTWRAAIALRRKGAGRPVFTAIGARKGRCRAWPARRFCYPGHVLHADGPTGRRVLAEGWDWPGPQGAAMAGPEARLRFSLMGRGTQTVWLEIAPGPLLVAGPRWRAAAGFCPAPGAPR